MKKYFFIAASLLMLSGCDLMPSRIDIVEVKIPTAFVPAPPKTEKPRLVSDTLSVEKDGYDLFVKGLESDLIRIDTYAKSLENVIKTYDDLSKQYPNLEVKVDVNPK